MENFDFLNGNPGAVQHGNFINYYQFHPAEKRMAFFPSDCNFWTSLLRPGTQKISLLDVGCNAGELSIAIYNFFTKTLQVNCSLVGIDIDHRLIERAVEKFGNKYQNVKFTCLDVMDKNALVRKSDVVFCFSITMWIHLNHGDDGLWRFLRSIASIAKVLVIEPQPWKCYRTAVKRMKTAGGDFPNFNKLHFRNNIETDIDRFLTHECSMHRQWESDRTEWGRKLIIYHHKLL